jgi:hypothetical protein
MQIVHRILAVVIGLIVAFPLVAAVEALGHVIYPPPPGTDLSDPEALRTIIGKLPTGAIVVVLVAWALGMFCGAFCAGYFARRMIVGSNPWIYAFIVGGLLMAAGIYTMVMIPHPLWFVIAALAIFVVFTSLGAMLAQRLTRPRGPQPYDIRNKNMAC